VQARAVTPLSLVGIVIAAFVFYTHRENIGRLMRGNERKIGGKEPAQAGGTT
jgi:glycerol-3-phosphate acyltransferase PlsY